MGDVCREYRVNNIVALCKAVFMRKALSRYFIIAAFVVLSCSKDDSAPVYNFSVTLKPGYFSDYSDAWVFLHDRNGKAIDEGQLHEGQTSHFNIREKNIGVTIVSVDIDERNSMHNFSLENWLNVNAEASWTLRSQDTGGYSCGQNLGNAEITVSDQNVAGATVSLRGFAVIPDPSTSTDNTMEFSTVPVYAGCNNIFLSAFDNTNIPFYKFLENAQPGQYIFSLSQLSSFDHVVEVSHPGSSYVSANVVGFTADQSVYGSGYYIISTRGIRFPNQNLAVTRLGYLDRFPKYKTYIYCNTSEYAMEYEEVGGAPSSVKLPESLAVTISDKTLEGYAFSVNEPIFYRSAEFGFYQVANPTGLKITLNVYAGPENDFKPLGEIPVNFHNSYPEVTLNLLKLQSSTFYQESQTIEHIVAQKFGKEPRPEVDRSVSKTFFNF